MKNSIFQYMFGMLARLETYHGVGCLTDTEDLGW